MSRSPLLFGALGSVFGVGVGYFLGKSQQGSPFSSPVKISKEEIVSKSEKQELSFDSHPALCHGMPIAQNLRVFQNYVSSFDSRTRNPQWVIEYINHETAFGEGDRSDSAFKEDANIPHRLRSKLEDYRNSGYDRGHLAPAANHKGSQEALDETFVLSNISPQVGKGFNRSYWARVEKFVRDLTKEYEEVHVVTGPLFLPSPVSPSHDEDLAGATTGGGGGSPMQWRMQFPMIGKPPQLVAVPTHFFKVVLARHKTAGGKQGPLSVAAFVIPNTEIQPQVPLSSWLVPIEHLEAAAGMQFFPSTLTPASLTSLVREEERLIQRLGRGEKPTLLLEGVSIEPSARKQKIPADVTATANTYYELMHLCNRSRCELGPEIKFKQGSKKRLSP